MYKIDNYCEKIGELPHCFISENEGIGFCYDIYSTVFSPNSMFLATIDIKGMLRLWNEDNSKFINFKESEKNSVMRFSIDGKYLLLLPSLKIVAQSRVLKKGLFFLNIRLLFLGVF